MSDYYEEAEDTFLLYNTSREYLKTKNCEKVCEVGVGNCFTIENLAKEFPSVFFYGTDYNFNLIKRYKEKLTYKNIFLEYGDLLSPFQDKKFDLIIFNPPYLPLDKEVENEYDTEILALYGGKKGYEVILRFLENISINLKREGEILLIMSSLTKTKVVENFLNLNEYNFEIKSSNKFFFEELYCYNIRKSTLRKELEDKGLTNLKYLSKGKHSKVLQGNYFDRDVVVKYSTYHFIDKENLFLDKLKESNFIPKVHFSDKNYVVMEKIKGTGIKEFIKNSNKYPIYKVLSNILEFTLFLDEKGINKKELTNPYKHILIDDNLNIKFIDFERATLSKRPQNTTQFLEFLRRNSSLLEEKGILINKDKLSNLSKSYSYSFNEFSIEEILFFN